MSSNVVSTILEQDNLLNMTLRFLVNGEDKTKYVFNATDGTITLWERTTEHINSYAGFLEGMELVQEWLNKIVIIHRETLQRTALNAITKFTIQTQYTSQGILKYTFKIGPSKVINTDYDPVTKLITFDKRSSVTMYFKDFQNLFLFQKYIAASMKLINRAETCVEANVPDIL